MKLLREGLAYPTYYKGLFSDLREACTEAVADARGYRRELWADDRTTSGFDVQGIADLTDRHVILPKLFRRLAEFLGDGGSVSGFKTFLANRLEGVTIISRAHFTHLDTVVEVSGSTVRMTEPPENLMFEG
jgi:hypothetical protein